MVDPLVILGSGPHAREIAGLVDRINAVRPTWDLLGFVSERARDVGRTWDGHPVLALDALERSPEALVVPESEWWALDCVPRERYASLVDPSSVVSPTASIGRGCVLFPHGYVGHEAALGDFVFCLPGCVISHGAVLEERVMLTSRVSLAGDVHLETGCYLGQGSTVRQRLRVGRSSIVGMGSVVVRDVPARTVVLGNPARDVGPVADRHRVGAGMGEGEWRRLQEVAGRPRRRLGRR